MAEPKKHETAGREMDQFLYAVSHDLQEPLRKVCTFGERLAAKLAGRLDSAAGDDLARMLGAARRGQSMIEGLLVLSRIETGGGPFTQVDLNTTIAGVLDNLRDAADACGAEVEVGPLPAVRADASQMALLFAALLDNALKFRSPAIRPRIRVAADCGGGAAGCQIVVADNGIGIEPHHAERIFTVFQRLHPRDVYPGLGLGLAIARRIARRHGGEIAVESAPDQGSCFVVTLPAAD
jgi:light-regulated signal transduction histidine kinase (bacteriophytochrome)